MSPPPSGLLDTSVFVARESGRTVGPLPAINFLSVVTLGELELGVRAAADPETRARRGATLTLARSVDAFPIREAEMMTWAQIVADCRTAGLQRVVRLADTLIAATAVQHGLPVITQDDDFERIAHAHPALSVWVV